MQIDRSEIIDLLSQTPLFSYLDPGRLNRLTALCSLGTYRAGESIFSEGDPSDEMYVIYDGQVTLSADKKGKQPVFASLQRGDLFGEEALLVDDPRFYQAVAATDLVLICLSVENYLYLYEEMPEIEERLEVSVDSRRLSINTRVPWLGEDEYVQVIARRHPVILWRRKSGPIPTAPSMP